LRHAIEVLLHEGKVAHLSRDGSTCEANGAAGLAEECLHSDTGCGEHLVITRDPIDPLESCIPAPIGARPILHEPVSVPAVEMRIRCRRAYPEFLDPFVGVIGLELKPCIPVHISSGIGPRLA
jgi:hypothetical protein